MERYEIRKTETLPEQKAAEELLRKIFILEKSVFSETTPLKFSHNNDCLAAFFQGRPVAALYFSADIKNAILDITCFGVAAEFRRQNVGRMLMKEVMGIARRSGIKTMVVDTLAGARTFFLAHGFKETEKPRISGNNASVRMCKELE